MERFRNKYRVQSHRMLHWDYSGNGVYFITLVTQNRECNLGTICNENMVLSEFGKIVHNEWLKSFDIRHELFLDEYIIMPNHLHAIVVLDNFDKIINPDSLDETHGTHVETHGVGTHVETHGRASLRCNIPKYNKNNHFFQPNYHDHIIRNSTEYQRIKNYIINNPMKWNDDKFNPLNNP